MVVGGCARGSRVRIPLIYESPCNIGAVGIRSWEVPMVPHALLFLECHWCPAPALHLIHAIYVLWLIRRLYFSIFTLLPWYTPTIQAPATEIKSFKLFCKVGENDTNMNSFGWVGRVFYYSFMPFSMTPPATYQLVWQLIRPIGTCHCRYETQTWTLYGDLTPPWACFR